MKIKKQKKKKCLEYTAEQSAWTSCIISLVSWHRKLTFSLYDDWLSKPWLLFLLQLSLDLSYLVYNYYNTISIFKIHNDHHNWIFLLIVIINYFNCSVKIWQYLSYKNLIFGLIIWFNGISTLGGYLIPNSVYTWFLSEEFWDNIF